MDNRKCNEIKSIVITALFLTVTYSLITLFLDSYLFFLYSFENSSDELSLVNIEHDEYLNSAAIFLMFKFRFL